MAFVRQQIERGGERLWRLDDFRNLPFEAVAQALSRLTRQGRLERLSKGVYYSTRQTAFGKSRPNPAAIQKLASRRKGVFPAGIAAANLLGFTTQTARRSEISTSALSLPRKLVGTDTVIHTRRPEAWAGLSQSDAALLDFLRRADNVLLIGKPGTGKTGLAIGLLREACLNGYRGRFTNAQVLLDELYASLADRTTTRLLAQLSRMQPLLIDELGYLTIKPEQANAFFRLMDQRYARVSTIITTNLDLSDWYELFDKKPLVDALLDRLQHHCITIRIDGPSLRNQEPQATPSEKPVRRTTKA